MSLKSIAGRLLGQFEALSHALTYIRATPEERPLMAWYTRYLGGEQGGGLSLKQGYCSAADGSPIPWMTYGAIEYLNQFDLSGRTVLEFGSGSSTTFWAARTKHVTSVENDRSWYDKQRGALAPNVTLILAETAEEYIRPPLEHRTYDIVVVDGRYRFDCAVRAVDWVAANGFIILDNADWHPNTAALFTSAGFFQIDFAGPGPLNAYAWATSFFLRPNCFLQTARRSTAPVVIGGIDYVSDEDVSLVK